MRKGSALLIVLGMISFMLFSGIAFSVYMRQTRLPSTFLRRTTVTRQLAKAALAEAIEEIDYRIGSDPHPGVRAGGDPSSGTGIGSSSGTNSNNPGNYWNHRVFVRNRNYADSETGYTGDDTISTLSLEGLAYLPPSLINEVRYYSRHTPTAKWQPFRFDAGRYAYCAIDVSDYFDVNRLLADRPRSSASSRRITFAHVFEDTGKGGLHGAQKAGAAEEWDAWLENDAAIRKVDQNTDEITFNGLPMVSLADFNLLMSTKSFGKIKSPFVTYLDSSGNAFYADAGTSDEDAQAEGYRAMTFVTDSLFRKPTADERDLEDPENQPFDTADLKRKGMTLVELQNKINGRAAVGGYLELLSRIGMATLYDYLDEDSLPISLTLPTVEQNPMICGINPHFEGATFKVTKKVDDLRGETGKELTYPETKERLVSQKVQYLIDGGGFGMSLAGRGMEGVALYPFLHTEGATKSSYNLDGKMALYLSKDGDKIRMASGAGNDNFVFGSNGSSEPESTVTLNETTGLISIPLSGTLPVPPSVKSEDEAVIKFTVNTKEAKNLKNVFLDSGAAGKHWISLTYQWKQTFTGKDEDDLHNDSLWSPQPGDGDSRDWKNVVGGGKAAVAGLEPMSCRWYPIDGTGRPITKLETIYGYITGGTKFHLNMALWLRIRRAGGDSGTVDMVPASAYDDKEQKLSTINPNQLKLDENLHRYYRDVEALGRYVMRFGLDDDAGTGFSLKDVTDSVSLQVQSIPKQVMIKDPRYNHNPNNWIVPTDQSGDLAAYWKEHNDAKNRDGDIFMAVSNQGYLQSIYELGFLPRLTNPGSTKNDPVGQNFGASNGNRTDFGTGADQDGLMWNTYRVFGTNADPLYGPGFVSGLHGLKVNPYSDSMEVLAAAFANTPADWAHASTNETMNVSSTLGADDFNAKYAWNAYSSGSTKLMWNDVLDVAYAYSDAVRASNGDWESAFERLPWSSDRRKLLNGEKELDSSSSDLYSVDKKFLFGFWKDCFAANQQLFLIFVRAEPMMMGGGVAGNAPPQLSSRAVALVWRDPEGRKSGASNPGSSSSSVREPPHGLRVLFYHPLD